MKKLILFSLSVILISSCSIQKRVYLSGYNIDWKSNAKHVESKKIASNKFNNKITPIDVKTILEQNKNEVPANTNEHVLTASAAKQINQINTKSIKLLNKNGPLPQEKQNKSTLKSKLNGNKIILLKEDGSKLNGLALTGFITSLVGLFYFLYLGIPFGILAIIFSAIGLHKINKNPGEWKGKGFAIAGLVIGIVSILLWILLFALLVAIFI